MPRNHFEKILSILHFNNNEQIPDRNAPNYDRVYKLNTTD